MDKMNSILTILRPGMTKCLFGIVCMCSTFITPATTTTPTPTPTPDNVLFQDDFGDGDYDGWGIDGNLAVSAAGGQLSYDSDDDGIVYTLQDFNPPYTFEWKLIEAPEKFHSFVLGSQGFTQDMLLVIMNTNTGTVYYYGSLKEFVGKRG